jgi:hypothetical protein
MTRPADGSNCSPVGMQCDYGQDNCDCGKFGLGLPRGRNRRDRWSRQRRRWWSHERRRWQRRRERRRTRLAPRASVSSA